MHSIIMLVFLILYFVYTDVISDIGAIQLFVTRNLTNFNASLMDYSLMLMRSTKNPRRKYLIIISKLDVNIIHENHLEVLN